MAMAAPVPARWKKAPNQLAPRVRKSPRQPRQLKLKGTLSLLVPLFAMLMCAEFLECLPEHGPATCSLTCLLLRETAPATVLQRTITLHFWKIRMLPSMEKPCASPGRESLTRVKTQSNFPPRWRASAHNPQGYRAQEVDVDDTHTLAPTRTAKEDAQDGGIGSPPYRSYSFANAATNASSFIRMRRLPSVLPPAQTVLSSAFSIGTHRRKRLRLFPRKPTKEVAVPYLSYLPTVGRNSQFVDLTEEQREELGGIEYRSLKLLGRILWGDDPFFFFSFFFFLFSFFLFFSFSFFSFFLPPFLFPPPPPPPKLMRIRILHRFPHFWHLVPSTVDTHYQSSLPGVYSLVWNQPRMVVSLFGPERNKNWV